MSDLIYLIQTGLNSGILNDPSRATGVFTGGFADMAIGGRYSAAFGYAAGRISYGIYQNFENIRRNRISLDTLWNGIKMIPSIYSDISLAHVAGTYMAPMFEKNRGQMKREDGVKNENSESKKEESDTTKNIDRDTHAQPTSSNADASEAEKAPSTSSGPDASEGEKAPSTSSGPGVPVDEKKGPSHPELMPQKSRKRHFSDQDLEFQAIKRIKPSTAALY